MSRNLSIPLHPIEVVIAVIGAAVALYALPVAVVVLMVIAAWRWLS